VYLDTAILVKLLVREPDSRFYAELVEGEVVWSSRIVVTECFSALLRKERERGITPSHRRRAWRQVEADIAARRLNLVTLTADVLARANGILGACHHRAALARCPPPERCQSWPIYSNDRRVRQAATRLGLPLAPTPR